MATSTKKKTDLTRSRLATEGIAQREIPEYITNPRKRWEMMLAALPPQIAAYFSPIYSERDAAQAREIELCPLPTYFPPFNVSKKNQRSDYWRELGNRFADSGKVHGKLGAVWSSLGCCELQNVQLFERGVHLEGASKEAILLFESLATMGAEAAGYTGEMPINAWIDQLRRLRLNSREGPICSSAIYGGPTLHSVTLYLERIFSSSASFCAKLESDCFLAQPRTKIRSSPEPLTREQIARRQSLSQNEAAVALDCSERQIRNLRKNGTLTPAGKGRVVCDSKFEKALRRRHGSIVG